MKMKVRESAVRWRIKRNVATNDCEKSTRTCALATNAEEC